MTVLQVEISLNILDEDPRDRKIGRPRALAPEPDQAVPRSVVFAEPLACR